MEDTLLVELQTEELPPKALKVLGDVFGHEILNGLIRHQLQQRDPRGLKIFATPRRLAVVIPDILTKAGDRETETSGPSLKVGLDSNGKPTAALVGFAKKNGVSVESLEQRDTSKGKLFVARITTPGLVLDATLSTIVAEAAKKLPIPKVMRWGDGEARFVRPVHGLVMMHGSRVLPGEVLGLKSTNRTQGHRFLSAGPITLKHANDYERALREEGKVVASFDARHGEIVKKLNKIAGDGVDLVTNDALLEEITALVEAPTVYAGEFSPDYLAIPEECLILSMQQHQKYVPLRDKANGKLLPRFLFVSNLNADDPSNIIRGNGRVLRARLSDANFFYDQDRKTRLETRVPKLAHVVYHNKLGNQLERVQRLQKIAAFVAGKIGADVSKAERAAYLCKADLLTDMVGEFPELQGVMGRYYSLNDGEAKEVADAIDAHYRPRFAGDVLPEGDVACAVALADKLYVLAGLFGIGQQPSGDKDPFGLRRAALGVLRILMEKPLKLNLFDLIRFVEECFPKGIIKSSPEDIRGFFRERFRNYLRDRGEDAMQIEAVVTQLGGLIYQAPSRLRAVSQFSKLPEAKDLAAANKRVLNIIKKNEEIGYRFSPPSRALMTEPAEIALMDAVDRVAPAADKHFANGDYESSLRLLAGIKSDVDRFFDEVMVMVDDAETRNNRAALLQRLGLLMNKVADISKLAA